MVIHFYVVRGVNFKMAPGVKIKIAKTIEPEREKECGKRAENVTSLAEKYRYFS